MLLKKLVFNFMYSYLIANGLHLGHAKSVSILQASQFFYKMFQGYVIMNIFYTSIYLKKALSVFFSFFKDKGDFWFVNKDISLKNYMDFISLACGEVFLNFSWIPGSLTNFKVISKSVNKFFLKKELVSYKDLVFFNSFKGFMFWTSFPSLVLLLNSTKNYLVPFEMISMNFFGSVHLVDTNVDSYSIFYSLPMNDDSLKSLVFISKVFSMKIMVNKLSFLVNWSKYRKFRFLKIFSSFMKFSSFGRWVNFLSKSFFSRKVNFYLNDFDFLRESFFKKVILLKKISWNRFFFVKKFFSFLNSFSSFNVYNLRYKSYELYFDRLSYSKLKLF